MKALLLAAGFGTRLRPLTDTIPKCLVPINNKPLLQIWIEMLTASGINDILVNKHYLSDQVTRFINSSDAFRHVRTVYEKNLLGTAGTLLANRDFFDGSAAMLIHADNLSRFNMYSFIQRHLNRPTGTCITMMTFSTDIPQTCGIVEVDGNDVVVAFHEKVSNSPGNLANGAVYIVEPEVFDFLVSLNKKVIDFSTEIIPRFLGRIYTFYNDDYHRDIGNPESYEAAQYEFK